MRKYFLQALCRVPRIVAKGPIWQGTVPEILSMNQDVNLVPEVVGDVSLATAQYCFV